MILSSVSWAANGPDMGSWISSWHSTPKRSWAPDHLTIRQTSCGRPKGLPPEDRELGNHRASMSILFSQRLDAAEFSAVHSTVCSLDPLVVSFVWPRLSR